MRVFISGPITGYVNGNKEAFDNAEKMLREHGYDVFNPTWMKFSNEWTSKEILNIDLSALVSCEAMYQLPGWENSVGANIEYQFATSIDKSFVIHDPENSDNLIVYKGDENE